MSKVVRYRADVRLLRENKSLNLTCSALDGYERDMSELLGANVNPVSGRCGSGRCRKCVYACVGERGKHGRNRTSFRQSTHSTRPDGTRCRNLWSINNIAQCVIKCK